MLLLARNLNDICVPEIGNWSASKVLLENGLIGDWKMKLHKFASNHNNYVWNVWNDSSQELK